ncbi:Aldo-keto reductase yakc [NADP(+)], partial [Leucoagaricus sp. SymC.cos]
IMGLSAFYGQVDSDKERFKFLDTALEDGWTFWDSADVYGDSEDLVGKWFKRTGNRDKIFLAIIFRFVVSETGQVGVSGKPEYVKSACAKSLKRLGVYQIDLYYLHKADPTVPIEQKITGAMAELRRKVRYLGLSEVSSPALRRAHTDTKVALLKTYRELGIAIIASTPLGRGLHTGQYKSSDDFEEDDLRKVIPKFVIDPHPESRFDPHQTDRRRRT